jgi:hypothetical protein
VQRIFVPQFRPRRGPLVHDQDDDGPRRLAGRDRGRAAGAVGKVEKKLQELPHLDRIESYSQAGGAFIRVTLSDKSPPAMMKDVWYHGAITQAALQSLARIRRKSENAQL